jgi:hypothetical protein
MALKRWDLRKQGDSWAAVDRSGNAHASAPTKKDAVSKAATAARGRVNRSRFAFTIVTAGSAEERTYPRSADPRSSKG